MSPRVAPTEKNIDGLKPREVLIDSKAKVPGPGVTANTQAVIKRIIKLFNSIISLYLSVRHNAFNFYILQYEQG